MVIRKIDEAKNDFILSEREAWVMFIILSFILVWLRFEVIMMHKIAGDATPSGGNTA